MRKIRSDTLKEMTGDKMDKWRSQPERKNGSSIVNKGKEKCVGTDSGRMIYLMIGILEILF